MSKLFPVRSPSQSKMWIETNNVIEISSSSDSDSDPDVDCFDQDVFIANSIKINGHRDEFRYEEDLKHQPPVCEIISSEDEDEQEVLPEFSKEPIEVVTVGAERSEIFRTVSADPKSPIAKQEPSAPESPTSIEPEDMQIEEESDHHEPYGASNMEAMREDEVTYRPKAFYMHRQPQITGKMRRKLVTWLLDFCNEQNLQTETVHLAVSHIDRFASRVVVQKSNLNLVGLTALLIAAEEQEIEELEVTDLLELSGELFAEEDVLQMREQMKKYLKFKLNVPTALNFVNEFCEAVDSPPAMKAMSKYLVDLALAKGCQFLRFLPSRTAAAAIALARMHQDMALWSDKLEEITGCNIDWLRKPIIALAEIQGEAFGNENCAIYRRYSTREFMHVSAEQPYNITEASLRQITQDPSRFKGEEDSTPLGELMSQLFDE